MYRPCFARGRLAIFHRWCETDVITLRFKTEMSKESRDRALREYHRCNVLPNCLEREKTRQIVAVVEYEDGTVDEVNPSDIEFLDSKKYLEKKDDDQ